MGAVLGLFIGSRDTKVPPTHSTWQHAQKTTTWLSKSRESFLASSPLERPNWATTWAPFAAGSNCKTSAAVFSTVLWIYTHWLSTRLPCCSNRTSGRWQCACSPVGWIQTRQSFFSNLRCHGITDVAYVWDQLARMALWKFSTTEGHNSARKFGWRLCHLTLCLCLSVVLPLILVSSRMQASQPHTPGLHTGFFSGRGKSRRWLTLYVFIYATLPRVY